MGRTKDENRPDEGDRRQREVFLVSEPEALRAFAHPLRQRILLELSMLEHGRAADLARVLDQPANAISFHLRALARAGLIVEAPEHARDRRDRVWKPVADSYALDRHVPGWTAVVDPLLDWVRNTVMEPVTDESVHRQLAASQLSLTRAEAEELAEALSSVISEWSDRSGRLSRENPADPERSRYQVVFTIGPWGPPPAERARSGVFRPPTDGTPR